MANELVHGSVGTSMTQVEFEAVGLHVFNNQATGDLPYASSATQLSRLGIGSAGQFLIVSGGIPAWSNTLAAVTLSGTVTGGSQVINSIGHIGIGVASNANYGLTITESYAAPDAAKYGILVTETFTGNTANYLLRGIMGDVIFNTATTSSGVMNGVNGQASSTHTSTSLTATVGVRGVSGNAYHYAAGGTVTGAAALMADYWGSGVSGGTITNAYGAYIRSPWVVGTVTNAYGIYIENITGAGTLNYALYSVGGIFHIGGTLQTGTYTAGAATDSTGYITINDAAGNARKLMVQA